MNARLVLLVSVIACGGLFIPSQAQTPASNPPGRYQPLSPTAVNIRAFGCKTIRGNIVGQYQTSTGLHYIVQTRKGQITVDQWAFQKTSAPPPCPPRRQGALAYVHSFH